MFWCIIVAAWSLQLITQMALSLVFHVSRPETQPNCVYAADKSRINKTLFFYSLFRQTLAKC